MPLRLQGSPAFLIQSSRSPCQGLVPPFCMGQPSARVLEGRSEGRVGGGKQWNVVTAVRGWLPQQGRPAAQLPIPEHLGQELAFGLRQKHDAEDAEESTGRQHHVLQESSVAHVEALGWATQPAKCPQGHDQAQASAPGRDGQGTEPVAVGLTPALLQQPPLFHPSGPVLSWRLPWQHPCSHRTVVGMTSAARRVLRMPAAWEEKRPRTEKVVMAASFRSGGSRDGACEQRWGDHAWPSPCHHPL